METVKERALSPDITSSGVAFDDNELSPIQIKKPAYNQFQIKTSHEINLLKKMPIQPTSGLLSSINHQPAYDIGMEIQVPVLRNQLKSSQQSRKKPVQQYNTQRSSNLLSNDQNLLSTRLDTRPTEMTSPKLNQKLNNQPLSIGNIRSDQFQSALNQNYDQKTHLNNHRRGVSQQRIKKVVIQKNQFNKTINMAQNFPEFQRYDQPTSTSLQTHPKYINAKNIIFDSVNNDINPNQSQEEKMFQPGMNSNFNFTKKSYETLNKKQITTPDQPNYITDNSNLRTANAIQSQEIINNNQLIQELKQQCRDVIKINEDKLVQWTGDAGDDVVTQSVNFNSKETDNLSPEKVYKGRGQSNIHQLYQDCYIQDIRKELTTSKKEQQEMYQQILQKQALIDKLKANNLEQQGKLNLYTQILSEEKNSKNKFVDKFQTIMNHAALKLVGNSKSPLLRESLTFKKKTIQEMSFSDCIGHMNSLLKSKSLVQLLNNTRMTLEVLLGADQVNFFFMETDSIQLFKQEGGHFQYCHHNHFGFQIAMPSYLTQEQRKHWELVPLFKQIKDVEFDKCFNVKSCVWPIRAFQKKIRFDENPQGKLFMLIQLEANDKDITFNPFRDGDCLRVISQIFYQVYTQIKMYSKVNQAEFRASEILETFKSFLAERRYISLCVRMMSVFPKLFKFQSCSVLFIDPKSQDLFKLNCTVNDLSQLNDPEEVLKIEREQFQNLVKFPTNIGMTGQAIQQNQIVFFNEGERPSMYSAEIDNCFGMPNIESVLVVPIRDTLGNLKGVVQLLNRLNGEKISTEAVFEIQRLIPSLSEIFKTVEDVRAITNISTKIETNLIQMQNKVVKCVHALEERDVAGIARNITELQKHIYNLNQVKMLEDRPLRGLHPMIIKAADLM